MDISLRALAVTDWDYARLCAFVDGAAWSIGEVTLSGRGSSRSGEDREVDTDWSIAAPFNPGQVIEFGYVATAPSKHISFTVDR